jgi:hypothetical protein
MRNAYQVLVGNVKKRGHFEGLDVDGRGILKFILKKQGGSMWVHSSGSE